MHRRNSDHFPYRPVGTHANRHAISMAGHLLMAGIWLEHRLISVPRRGFRWVETSGRRTVSTLVVRAYDVQVDPTRNGEL